jgi:hypothetical protein
MENCLVKSVAPQVICTASVCGRATLILPVVVGCKVVLLEQFQPKKAAEAIARHPCFALCDSNGKLIVEIQHPLPSDRTGLASECLKVYESYLQGAPEFGRFWRRFAKRLSYF